MSDIQPTLDELLALEPLHPTQVAERGSWQVVTDYWVSIEQLQEALMAEMKRTAELELALSQERARTERVQRKLDSWESTFGPTEEPG